MKNCRVLITGANGFIGKHLTECLVKEGAQISCFVKPGSLLRDIDWNPVSCYEVDITDMDTVFKVINKIKPQVVFHLAAITNNEFSFANIKETVEVNLLGTANILEALSHTDYECFVNISTGEVYGHNDVPFSEEQRLNPISPYSASKAAAEMLCTIHCETANRRIVTLRPSIVYGPMQSEMMLIPQVILAALRESEFKMTKGEQTRDFIYVSDMVNGIIKASETKAARGEILNLASGKSYTIRDVVMKILTLLGNRNKVIMGGLEYRPNEIWESCFNIDKAMNLLKWKPQINLETGLKMTVDWYSREFRERRLN